MLGLVDNEEADQSTKACSTNNCSANKPPPVNNADFSGNDTLRSTNNNSAIEEPVDYHIFSNMLLDQNNTRSATITDNN